MLCFFLYNFKGYVDIVRLLLKHGAKVEETNENGHTPLVIVFSIASNDVLVSVFRWKQLVVDMSK